MPTPAHWSSCLHIQSIVCLLVWLAGCVSTPKDTETIHLRNIQTTDFIESSQGPWPEAKWWHHFDDSQLNQLIDLAVQNSPSIDSARARIETARASAEQTAAQAGVKLDVNASITRQRYSANSIYPPPFAGAIDNFGHISLDFNYDFDWWGKQKALLEAAIGQRRAAEAEAIGAMQTVISAVSQTYFAYQTTSARLDLAKQRKIIQQQLLDLQQQRVQAGLDNATTLELFKSDLANLEQYIVTLHTDQAILLNQLRALIGVPGNQFPKIITRPVSVTNNLTLPVDLPFNLLGRRADIAAARAQIYAAQQNIRSAKADFYPNINLSSFIGFESIGLGSLLQNNSHIVGIAPALSLPIFHSGALQAAYHGAQAITEQAIAAYNQTLINAVQEVNQAALRMRGNHQEAIKLDQQLAAHQRHYDLLNQQTRAGLVNSLQVLQAQLALLSLQDQQQQLYSQTLTATVQLYKALGGGYQDNSFFSQTNGSAH